MASVAAGEGPGYADGADFWATRQHHQQHMSRVACSGRLRTPTEKRHQWPGSANLLERKATWEIRGVAQLAESRSPKPVVVGSSPASPAGSQHHPRQRDTLRGHQPRESSGSLRSPGRSYGRSDEVMR